MSGHCHGCGTYHEEDDDRLCGRCVEKTSNARKEADQLTANCTHGMEFAETAEHYADLRTRIRACIGYQIIERERARQELKTLREQYAQDRMSRKRESLSDNTKMENQ